MLKTEDCEDCRILGPRFCSRIFTYTLRTFCLLLTFCFVPICFYLPLPAVSIDSALTSVPDHLFLLLVSFCSNSSFSSSFLSFYHSLPDSFFFLFLLILLSWIPSVFSLSSGSFRYKCTFKTSRCYFLLLGLRKARGEHTLSIPNALQALVAVTINGCRRGCVHHNLMPGPVLLPPSSPLHLQIANFSSKC